MDADIALILLQDGVVNGAIYALLALSLVLVFTVTRVILIPQGELVAYGALTYAALGDGRLPGSVWLLCALGAGAFLAGMAAEWRLLSAGSVLRLGVTRDEAVPRHNVRLHALGAHHSDDPLSGAR